MGNPLRANNSGLMPLIPHLMFDIEGIHALNTKSALALAQHTINRLETMNAPKVAFEKLLVEGILGLPELNAHCIIQAQARDFLEIAIKCANRTDALHKDLVISMTRRFRDYNLLRRVANELGGNPLSQSEFKEAAETLYIDGNEFSETACLLVLDAYNAYGMEFRKEIKAILRKKYAVWTEQEIPGVAVV